MAQGLWLIDVGTPIRGHVKNSSLLDLPNGFVEIFPGFFFIREADFNMKWLGTQHHKYVRLQYLQLSHVDQ